MEINVVDPQKDRTWFTTKSSYTTLDHISKGHLTKQGHLHVQICSLLLYSQLPDIENNLDLLKRKNGWKKGYIYTIDYYYSEVKRMT